MPMPLAPAADFHGNADVSPGPAPLYPRRERAPEQTYRAPARPPCDFSAARAMLSLIDRGFDPGQPPSEYQRLFLHWSVRQAFDVLSAVRSGLLPFDSFSRARCAINISADWSVVS